MANDDVGDSMTGMPWLAKIRTVGVPFDPLTAPPSQGIRRGIEDGAAPRIQLGTTPDSQRAGTRYELSASYQRSIPGRQPKRDSSSWRIGV